MAWFYLILAGLLETGWSTTLKSSSENPGFGVYLITAVLLALSMVLLALAMKSLPLSVAYPIWTGVGSIGSVIAGVAIFREHLHFTSLAGVVLICLGILLVSLKST